MKQGSLSKMYSLLLVLVFLMAGGGRDRKRRRSSAKQPVEQLAEDVGCEYIYGEESDTESTE